MCEGERGGEGRGGEAEEELWKGGMEEMGNGIGRVGRKGGRRAVSGPKSKVLH